MHDIEIPAQKQHTHNEAPCRPIDQKSAMFFFFFFQAPCLIKLVNVLIIKITLTLQRMTTQIVHNKIFFMLIFE